MNRFLPLLSRLPRVASTLLAGVLLIACGDDDVPPDREPCTTDAHCDDGFECTVDTCGVDSFCNWTPVDAVCGGELTCQVGMGCVGDTDGGGVDGGGVDGGGVDGGGVDGGGVDGGGVDGGGVDGGGVDGGGVDGGGVDGGGVDGGGVDGGGVDGGGDTCTGTARRCVGSTAEVCSGGTFVFDEACAIDCAAGECVTEVTCTPSEYRCNGSVSEACNSAGTAWLHVRTCGTGCAAGLCTGACEPGDRRCNGDMVETCDAGGASWSATETCGTFCAYGTCALDGLDIATNMDLNGEIYVDGDVLVRSGVTLSSSLGDLTIRAGSITVESGASIGVSASGLGPDGMGEQGQFCTGGFHGGTGGGYGTAGTRGPIGSSGRACSSGGRPFGSAQDSAVAQGGPGGDVRGSTSPRSPGGGRLRLIATGTIDVSGQITADGVPGVRAEGSSGLSTGGGAGGGVLLAANIVEVSGSVSAAGAGISSGTYGGTGGQGRIKILSGESRSVTGTLAGAVETQGLLPPLDPSSSTHPDSDLYYNDDFPFVTVAWDRAFPGRLGYYWLLSNEQHRVPTPAIGTFASTDTVSVDRDELVSGDNYFHVASVDPSSMVGTVETGFRIRLNTAPPGMSSSSHPSETAWSANRDAFFAWTTPNGPENYTGFYYVLDHYGDTVPTAADTYLPVTQTTLLRSGLADGLWVLHVVAIDTRGYLTRLGGHRQVRIGDDPGAGGVVGQVVNAAGGAAISGARVRINRGIVSDQLTNGTGNYNFMGVPAGTWEVEVSAEGFVPMTRMVTVTDGGSIPLNVSLSAS